MSAAEVDVVLPAYNAEATILVALSSILFQSNGNLRVIVVDDGSTDGTAEIVRDTARNDSRVHLEQKSNGGIVSALNRGLSLSTADYVARMDADDICESDRFERQMTYLDGHPDVVAVSGAHREIDGAGTPTGYVHQPPLKIEADFNWIPAKEPQLTQPFLFARRSALTAVKGYREFMYSEDTDLYWRLAEVGKLANLAEVVGSYRMHTGSVSSASVQNGRIMAFMSQLAALSAQRRALDKPDMVFDEAFSGKLRTIGSLEQMVLKAVADFGLTADEEAWLRLAVAAKLMELAGYRPYEIAEADCGFMAEAFLGRVPLSASNVRELRKMRAATAARLIRLGRLREAVRLAGPMLWPEVAARAASGRLYWRKHLH